METQDWERSVAFCLSHESTCIYINITFTLTERTPHTYANLQEKRPEEKTLRDERKVVFQLPETPQKPKRDHPDTIPPKRDVLRSASKVERQQSLTSESLRKLNQLTAPPSTTSSSSSAADQSGRSSCGKKSEEEVDKVMGDPESRKRAYSSMNRALSNPATPPPVLARWAMEKHSQVLKQNFLREFISDPSWGSLRLTEEHHRVAENTTRTKMRRTINITRTHIITHTPNFIQTCSCKVDAEGRLGHEVQERQGRE